MPSNNPNQDPKPSQVSLDMKGLTHPPKPEEQFRLRAQAELQTRADQILADVVGDLTGGPRAGDLSNQRLLSKPDSERNVDFETRLKNFISNEQTTRLGAIPPLYANVAAEIAGTRLNAAIVTAGLDRALKKALEDAVGGGVRTAIARINDKAEVQKVAKDEATNTAVTAILKNDPAKPNDFRKLTSHEIRTWILESTANMTQSDINKLENTGLFKRKEIPVIDQATGRQVIDPETGQPQTKWVLDSASRPEGRFRTYRNVSLGCWGVTLAATTVAVAGGIALGGIGIAMGCAASLLINGANTLAQSICKKFHDDAFKNTWKELRSELDTVDTNRCPAFVGLMYLMVDKYSPLVLFPNQTQLFTFGQPSSTEAVLQHLKDAAGAAMTTVNGQSRDPYYRGVNWKDKMGLAKNGIESLEQRWNGNWKQSAYWSSALTTMSFMGTIGFGLGALTVF